MATVKMSIAQWNAREKAIKEGDTKKAAAILDLGFQPEYDDSLLAATEAVILDEVELSPEDILDDVAAGLSNKEIYGKYDISPKKLSMIKKEAE